MLHKSEQNCNAAAFYDSVLGQHGVRIHDVFHNGLKNSPTHYYLNTNDELIQAAAVHDAKRTNVYHACATFREPINRKGENVLAAKALWVDLDVGEKKPYASKKEAVAAYERFRIAAGLPLCHVVDSGNGVHIYQPLTEPITPEQWDRIAGLFAQCLDHFGVKHDPSRTTDKASILRIPGTSNYKTTPPKPVTLKRMGVEAPAAEIWAKLKAYADANGVIVASKLKRGKVTETNDIIGNRTVYEPAYAEILLPKCAVLSEVADTGGDVPYEIWWRAMGVAKFLVDGEKVAESWTRNREATGHDKTDIQKAMSSWMGPTTCEQFSKYSSKCTTCYSHAGAA